MSAEAIISSALSTASSMRSDASGALGTALSKLGNYKEWGLNDIPYSPVISEFALGEVPRFLGKSYEAPDGNIIIDFAKGDLDKIPVADYGDTPVNSATKVTYTSPVIPAELRGFSGTRATVDPSKFVVPDMPSSLTSMDLTPPTLSNIVVPSAPSVDLPEFAASAPDTNIAAPTDFEARFAANYAGMSVSMRNNLDSAVDAYLLRINPQYKHQMESLESKLAQYIEGGTALAPEVERAIFNRARDKTNAEYLKTRDQIMKEGASKGFTIPGGAQYSALAQARQAASDNNARAAMEIAIKQAELEQANVQFAVTQSANLRGVVLQAAASFLGSMVQINGQAIEYARDVLTAAISLYDTMVKLVTVRLEGYKAEAQVYEIRLKAVMAVYDVYMAELKGLEAQVSIDVARVNAFRAKIEALGALATAYRATIEGVVAKGQLEKLKVEIFGEEVKVFSAEVGAKQAEWQGFSAQVQGEIAKQNAYGEQVRAYATEVEAQKAKISAHEVKVKATAAYNDGLLRAYLTSAQVYEALVRGASESAKAEVNSFDSTIKSYVASASAEEAKAKANMAAAEANQRNLISIYQVGGTAMDASARGYNSYMTGAAGVAVNAASVYGAMASSAMAGMNSIGAQIETTSK